MIIGFEIKKKKLIEALNVMLFHDIKLLFINNEVAFFEHEDNMVLVEFYDTCTERNFVGRNDKGVEFADTVWDGDASELENTDDFPKTMYKFTTE